MNELFTFAALFVIFMYLYTIFGKKEGFCGSNPQFGMNMRYAPDALKNKYRVHKYSHYYGFGCSFGRCYGEPYYVRKVL